ncbi:DUF6571 family protein [Streptomyces sp. NPDC088387]|uniref:DUF6571 family protein n=1 Tax=Streptomyces sp. NPDC088387 TaxID=3365859 RepID=UPI003820B069
MNLNSLRFGEFGKLSTAVADWTTLMNNLEALQREASEGLKGFADKANWAGVNSQVSKQFITKTAGEFSDAHRQAKTVRNILQDTHDELVGYRDRLKTAIDNGLKKNLTVMDTGNGSFTVTMNVHPDRAAEGHKPPDHKPEDVTALRDEVQRILQDATNSDNTAAEALSAIVGQAELGFSDAAFDDRDAAAQSLRDAQRVADLARKGDDMSPQEFDEMNRLLGAHKNDLLFQEKFATTLGPKATLDFWADMSDPTDGSRLLHDRRDQFAELQKNLGLTLAGATQSDSGAMRNWTDQMIQNGEQRFTQRGGDVYGFQIMSNLMRTGDYDDKFLNRYGDKLVAMEKEMRIPDRYWQMEPTFKTNFIGEERGMDPMSGYMNALSNSPDAATEFFRDDQPQDNARWVLKDRPYFDDSPLHDGPNEGKDAAGRALIAATTGMNPNDPNARFVEHTDGNRQVLDRSLGILAETKDDFPAEFRDDMAKILSNHGDSVHHTMSAHATDPNDPRQLDRAQLLEVTKQISRDQGAYGMLNEGLTHEIIRDIRNDHPDDPRETLLRAGATMGFLEEARYQALEVDKDDPSWTAKFVESGVGAAVSYIPVAGPVVDKGVGIVVEAWKVDETQRINEENQRMRGDTFTAREGQLQALADEWIAANPGGLDGANRYTVTDEINGAAFDGNNRAQGLVGK